MSGRFEQIRRKVAARSGFLTAALELTYRCNFECVHCYCVVGGPRTELTTSEYFELLDDLKASGCLTVTLTGGEAMLRPDFFEIAEYAAKQRFIVRLFSNGLLADGERLERLMALNLMSLDISLYGTSEETYRAVTGHEGFARVARNIDALRARGQRMLIKLPLMQENFADLDAMVAFCRERELPYNIDPWMTPKDDGSMKPAGHQISDEQLKDYFRRYAGKVTPKPRNLGKSLCTIGRGTAVIGPYGDVFGCVQSKISVGNIRERSAADIWRGATFLERERSLKFGDFVECNSCEFRESCFICPSVSFYENGRFNGPSKYACKAAQIRYEIGQFESRPVLHQIVVPGKTALRAQPAEKEKAASENAA